MYIWIKRRKKNCMGSWFLCIKWNKWRPEKMNKIKLTEKFVSQNKMQNSITKPVQEYIEFVCQIWLVLQMVTSCFKL